MAGGVALNCVANGKILRDKAFKDIWIQPASGDAGGAVGGEVSRGSRPRGGTFFLSMYDASACASRSSSRSSNAPQSPSSSRTCTTERTACYYGK